MSVPEAPGPGAPRRQDAILSRVAVQIGAHPALRARLAWRGGTCFAKLHLDRPYRYSEDLDYVLVSEDKQAGPIFDALREIAADAALHVGSVKANDRTIRVDLRFAPTSAPYVRNWVKVEINCDEVAPRFPLVEIRHRVEVSRWWTGEADILTYRPAELIGTKFRALAQRAKGRDLADLCPQRCGRATRGRGDGTRCRRDPCGA